MGTRDNEGVEARDGPTPTVLDGRLYTLGGAENLHCLDAVNGRVIWRKNLVKDVETGTVAYGYNCSPAVAGGVVAVPAFPGPGHQPKGIWLEQPIAAPYSVHLVPAVVAAPLAAVTALGSGVVTMMT
jgi:hypothetical protein